MDSGALVKGDSLFGEGGPGLGGRTGFFTSETRAGLLDRGLLVM